MEYFQDRVAVVTGGASGIGRGLCLELGRNGATVVAADLNADQAERTAASIREAGGRAESAALDVTRPDAVADLARDTADRHGRLDLMFNNAGVVVFGDVRDLTPEDWRRQLMVNMHGVVNGILAVYGLMAGQGFGHIVNTASLAGLVPSPTLVPYTTTKHAVVGLSAALRAEGRDLGVRVSVVCPGFVRTGMFDCPLRRVNRDELMETLPDRAVWTPEKAAKTILKGVARNREYIVFPFYTRLYWWLHRISPALSFPLRRKMIHDFRKFREACTDQ